MSWFSPWQLFLWLLLATVSFWGRDRGIVTAVPFGTCQTALQSSDADSNGELAQEEYVAFVRDLSKNQVGQEFYQYPTGLSAAFADRKTSDSAEAGAPLPSQDNGEEGASFCRDVYAGLVQALELSPVDNTTCFRSLTLGDITRDNVLAEREYPRFLSYLTSYVISSGTAFEDLESPLPEFFADFEDEPGSSGVNVEGSKPSTTNPVDSAQYQSLVDFCTVSLVGATLSTTPDSGGGGDSGGSANNTTTSVAPTPSVATEPGPSAAPALSDGEDNGDGDEDFVPSFTFSACTSAMAFSDLSRDALLDSSEYVRFLNRLSNDEYVDPDTSDSLDFSRLPTVLQDNYNELASGGDGINVEGGTRPGVDPTEEQAINLANVCNSTDRALQDARDGGGTPASPSPATLAPATAPSSPNSAVQPSAAPVVAAPTLTAAPAAGPSSNTASPSAPLLMSYETCVRYIMLSETSRDGSMDQSEYVRFLNLASGRAWTDLGYGELEPILRDNYEAFVGTDGTVSVVGYNPNVNATDEQMNGLKRFCERTSVAVQSALTGGGTWPPTSAPVPASSQTIYNGYLISNSAGIMASGMRDAGSSATRKALEDAYAAFVASQVDLYATGSAPKRRRLRRNSRFLRGQQSETSKMTAIRFLQLSGVELNPDSISTYSVIDSVCPANSTGSSCQTVYGNFSITVAAGTDPGPVVESLTTQIQAATSTDLQGFVNTAVAATPGAQPFSVDGPAQQTRPPGDASSRPPSMSPPTAAPSPSSGGKDSNASDPGKTAAAVIGFLVLIGCCVAGGIYLRRRGYKVSDAMAWTRTQLSKIPVLNKLMESRKNPLKKKSKPVGVEKADQASRDGGSTHPEDDAGIDNGGGFGTFEAVSPGDGKSGFYKGDAEHDGSSSVDYMEGADEDSESADFSVEQSGARADRAGNQQPAGKSGVFNAFGLGKKKNVGGLDDSYGSLQNAEAFQENPANDFADYGFDDPIADFGAKNEGSGSMGELFGKSDDFASGVQGSSWQNGEPNEWNSGWGTAGNADEAPRSSGDGGDDDDDSGSDSDESGSVFERKTTGDRGPTVEAPENFVHLDSMVEQGNWDGVMAAQTKFETGIDLDEASNPSRPSLEESEGLSESRSSADDFDEKAGAEPAGDESVNDSHWSMTTEEQARREQFRQQVESLVRMVVPDELDNVSAMMDQFNGREAELINTLQNMKERTSTQRARKAIHKSKGVPQRENPAFVTGGTDGSAAIAAASTLGVRASEYGEGGDGEFDDEEGSGDDEEGDCYDEDEEGQSHDDNYDDEYGDGEGSQYSGSRSYEEGEEGSQYSGSQSQCQDDQEGGSYYDDDDRSGSFSGSRSRSHDSGKYGDRDGGNSYDNDQDHSYDDEGQDESYYSGDDNGRNHRSGSGSYDDDDQDHDASYDDDQGNYDDHGEGSYQSGDDGSANEDDPDRSHSGSRSYEYDEEGDDQQGSYYSEEGSGSDSRRHDDDEGFVDYGYA
jgi:hypothetical protein